MTFEQATIEAFRSGAIRRQRLDPMGISELTVEVAGKVVTATWYGETGNPRYITISGDAYPGSVGAAQAIIREAMKRAEGLLAEKLAELDKLVETGK